MGHPNVVGFGRQAFHQCIDRRNPDLKNVGTATRQQPIVVAASVSEAATFPIEESTGNQYDIDLTRLDLDRSCNGLLVAPSVHFHGRSCGMNRQRSRFRCPRQEQSAGAAHSSDIRFSWHRRIRQYHRIGEGTEKRLYSRANQVLSWYPVLGGRPRSPEVFACHEGRD